MSRADPCPLCRRTGVIKPGNLIMPCPDCDGTGYVPVEKKPPSWRDAPFSRDEVAYPDDDPFGDDKPGSTDNDWTR